MATAATALGGSIEPLGDELARYCLERVPDLPRDEEAVAELVASARTHVGFVVALLRGEVAVDALGQMPPGALGYPRLAARRGTALPSLLRAYRLGTTWFWGIWTAQLDAGVADPGRRADALERSMAAVFEYTDRVIALAAAEHEAERTRWIRTPAATRRATVEQLLEDGADPADLTPVEQRLGYGLRRRHVALVAWTEHPVAEGGLAEAVRALAADAGWGAPLIVAGAEGGLWAWSATGAGEPAAAEPPPEPCRVALGEPGADLDGFRCSHRQALVARRTATLGGPGGPRLVRYRDVAVPALLAGDARGAQDFARTELGPLAAGDAQATRLRDTLAAFFAAGSRFAPAARTLGVHENTVAYRVRQAEAILGRPVGARRFELEAALRLAAAFPALALDEPPPAS